MAKYLALILILAAGCSNVETPADTPPQSLRLYVFDNGTLHYDQADAYRLKKDEVARTDMSLASFLVVHPKGTLMWDAGAVADSGLDPNRLSDSHAHRVARQRRTQRHDGQGHSNHN